MSENDSSNDALFQTPGSSARDSQPGHEELEPERPDADLGASPEFQGPTTRSGKKRKNAAPVKSSGKKKNKIMTTRSPTVPAAGEPQPQPSQHPQHPRHPRQPLPTPGPAPQPQTEHQDLAALLSSGLGNIQSSVAGMEARLSGMEARLGGKIDMLEATVSKNKESIVVLTDAVSKNAVDLARLEAQWRDGEAKLEQKIVDVVRAQGVLPASFDGSAIGQSGRHLSPDQVRRYWACRKSLRLWPIHGPDFRAAVFSFLTDKLGFEHGLVQSMGELRIERIIEPRSKIQNEALVEFPSIALRDSVKSGGYKLEGVRAGIRIEAPHFLKSDFHVLQNLSYRMKMAREGLKRSIKFDDDGYCLMLDIQIPGQDWQRIIPDQARQTRSAVPALRAGPLELTSEMIAGAVQGTNVLSARDQGGHTPAAASGSNAIPLGGVE